MYWVNATFVSYSGEFESMIDHMIIPVECVDTVRTCCILGDDVPNVSIHGPSLFV